MKIGVLSDTHLSELTPEFVKVVEEYFSDVDAVIHAGDIVGYPVYSYLEQFPLYAVRGNMDSPALQDILDAKIFFTLDKLKIGVTHGWGICYPIEENVLKEFPQANIVVYGHTHRPLIKHLPDGRLLFNPGSLKGNRPKYPPSVGLIHINGDTTVKAEIIYLTG